MSSGMVAQERNRYLLDIYEYDKQLNELMDRVIDSLGGQKENLKFRSFQSTGEITFQTGDKALFDLFYLKDDWVRVDQKTDNEYILFGRHGKRGWKHTLAKNGTKKEELKGIKLSEEHQFNFYENNLFDYKKKRLDIYFEGEMIVGEMEAYIIRLSGFKYGEEMYYISKKTYRPFMKQVYFLDKDYQSVINYTIEEYLEIDGIWLPKKIGFKKDGTSKMMEFFNYDLAAKFEKKFFVN
tara:strand:+ start:9530 stop:10243 length:714 start_codon:yes stop_codon:yes gene_type:complete